MYRPWWQVDLQRAEDVIAVYSEETIGKLYAEESCRKLNVFLFSDVYNFVGRRCLRSIGRVQ